MRRFPLLVVLGGLGSVFAAPFAHAETPSEIPKFDLTEMPRGTYIWADPDLIENQPPPDATSHNSNIIYLNGCFSSDSCVIRRGTESSINNRSSIVPSGTWTVPPFDAGTVAWDAVVNCVKTTYAAFNIVVTDQDPSPAPHFEAIVAGRPGDVGMGGGIGGVAPFSCGVINNAITFSFAEIYGGFVPQICWTVAQETAHAFGLEHEFLCADPMTYLGQCGASKSFQDVNADCGEFQASTCQCSGGKQNSVSKLSGHFGPSTPTPPTVSITEPVANAQVPRGFAIRADAMDDLAIARVELYINGQFIFEVTTQPYVFNAPMSLSDGVLNVEVRAFDTFDNTASAQVQVTQGEPCGSSSDCLNESEVCVSGRCVPGPSVAGGLGQPCTTDMDCFSGLCANGEDQARCVEICTDTNCPKNFGCISAGELNVCWWGADDKGCSVASHGRDEAPLLPLAFGILGFVFVMANRKRR